MIRIAICDDMLDQLELTATLIKKYVDEKNLGAAIITFIHPDKMLSAAEKTQFHIYLLDIVMPMVTGIELGIELRRMDRDAQIIYVTTAPEFALESFAVNPLGYLVKPIEKEKLFELLDLAFSRTGTSDQATIAVKTKEGLRVLNASSIVYCERLKNTVCFALSSGEKVESRTIRTKFTDFIAPLIESGQFIQPHVSFIVNMDRVERLTDREFVMRGGEIVPITSKYSAQMRRKYLDYMFNRGGE